jgi:hypothetical protein
MTASSGSKAALCHALSRLLIVSLFALPGLVRAERPMYVDDASTLERGGAKLEFGWARDGEISGWEGAAGYAPIDNVELEISAGRARDGTIFPSLTLYGRGFAAKWVPLQSDTGLSAGLKYTFVREEGTEVARTHGLSGLLSWSFTGDQLVHVNLGREVVDENGENEGTNVWGVGLDWPVTPTLRATAETFGAENSKPSQAIGLRYEIFPGFKASAAIGQSDGTEFGNAGVAWEF